MKYNRELPQEVEQKLDAYIERIKNVKWFKPATEIKKSEVESHVKLACETFGVKASLEFKYLKTADDWDAARGAAWDAARDAARGAAWDAARDAAWDAARDAAWDAARGAARGAAWDAAWDAARGAAWGAAWDAARDAAWGAQDVLALNIDEYKKKYPNGNFINLIPLYELGLYPVGVVDGKFLVYVPPISTEFPVIE